MYSYPNTRSVEINTCRDLGVRTGPEGDGLAINNGSVEEENGFSVSRWLAFEDIIGTDSKDMDMCSSMPVGVDDAKHQGDWGRHHVMKDAHHR